MSDKNKTILVVEDNERNMKLAVDLLELAGFHVLRAFDGETALEILKRRKPDLIILDILMPGISGSDVVSQLKENESIANVPIIYLSSLLSKEDESSRGNIMGGNVIFAKPYDGKLLIEKINEMLSN